MKSLSLGIFYISIWNLLAAPAPEPQVPPVPISVQLVVGVAGAKMQAIQNGFIPGTWVNIKGVVNDAAADSFSIDIQEHGASNTKGLIALHVRPHFKENFTEVKSRKDGVWDKGLVDAVPLLVKPVKPFSLTLFSRKDAFQVQESNGKMYTYKHTLGNLANILLAGVWGPVDNVEISHGFDQMFEEIVENSDLEHPVDGSDLK